MIFHQDTRARKNSPQRGYPKDKKDNQLNNRKKKATIPYSWEGEDSTG